MGIPVWVSRYDPQPYATTALRRELLSWNCCLLDCNCIRTFLISLTVPTPTPTSAYWKERKVDFERGQKEFNEAAKMNQFRGGMQVHSVPEHERAFDASGTRLPWGYEYAE